MHGLIPTNTVMSDLYHLVTNCELLNTAKLSVLPILDYGDES